MAQSVSTSNIGNNKVHPQKFAMWMAIGSMVMLFAGLTSAYLVHMSKGNWKYFNLPPAFWYSTITIILSSVTIVIAKRKIKAHDLTGYRLWLTITSVLGLVFVALQLLGFKELKQEHIYLDGVPSESLFYIIPIVHGLHVLGGIVALLVVTIRSWIQSKSTKSYSKNPVEIAGAYWHFVDFVWVYLFIFFLLTQQFKII